MKISIVLVLLIIFSILSPLFALAQVVGRDSVENNYAYRMLKMQLDSLEFRQNEVNRDIEEAKNSLTENSENAKEHRTISEKILMLENTLFDLKGKIGVVASKQSALRQEFIINNLTKNDTLDRSETVLNRNMLVNTFFSSNLTESERKLFLSEDANCDNLFFSLRDTIESKLVIIERTIRRLRTTQSKPSANALYNTAEVAIEKIEECNTILSGRWDKVYEGKLVAYDRLLKKLNVSDTLIKELKSSADFIKKEKAKIADAKLSPAFYSYSKEHEIILSYERLLAERMAYVLSLDSLDTAMRRIRNQSLDIDNPTFPKQDYIRFSSAEIGGKWVHSFANPVREVAIPTYGKVYMIKLLTSSTELNKISSLKNLNPVKYFKTESGEYEYYVGLYATTEEAEADVKKVKELGFEGTITEWKSGGKVEGNKVIPIVK